MSKAEDRPKRKKSRARFIIPAYLIILALLIGVVYVYPKVTGALEKTMTISYGSLENGCPVTCYIVRNETVYYSDRDGGVNYHYEEGTGVRAGTEILTAGSADSKASESFYEDYNNRAASVSDMSAVLSDQDRLDEVETALVEERAGTDDAEKGAAMDKYIAVLDEYSDSEANNFNTSADINSSGKVDASFGKTGIMTTTSSGTLSYILDGYEAAFSPYTMAMLDREKLEKLEYETTNMDTGKTLKGEPMFKIVDNRKWYAVAWIEPELLGSFSEGQQVRMDFPDGQVEGTVSKLYDQNTEIMVIMAFDCYYENLSSIRKVDTEIYTAESNGLLVENSFIASEDGVPGVYVMDVVGDTTFTPVKILATDGKNSLVASGYFYQKDENGDSQRVETVNIYDEIKKADGSEGKSSSESDAAQDSRDEG